VNDARVCILLATNNGQPYLPKQFESIFQQTCPDWRLYIRDDHSSDETVGIISRYLGAQECIQVQDNFGRLGVVGNFSRLIEVARQDQGVYFFLSDQDDVWYANKLADQLALMHVLEEKYPGQPLLVHSDMEVVDVSLNQVHPSFMQYQNIRNEDRNPLKVLLTQNFVTGCTVLVNRQLLDVALPVPKEAMMHDWWLALCAATFGHIGYIDQPLVQYRQHGSNAVGAKHISNYMNPIKTSWYRHWLKGRDNLAKSMRQAQTLAQRIKQHDPENKNLELIESYALLTVLPWWRRIRQLKKNHIHCQSWLRYCLMLSRLLFLSRQPDG